MVGHGKLLGRKFGQQAGERHVLQNRRVELAERFDLVMTGSSDYHGDGKPNRLAENTTTPEALERLIAATRGVEPLRA